MAVPDYATLLIISTVIFVSSGVSVMVTHALHHADAPSPDKRRFAVRMSAYALIWVGLALALAYSNVLVPRAEQTFPLFGALIVGSTILGGVLLLRSKVARAALSAIPVHWLATIQIYRIIGLVFLLLEADGLLSPYFALSTGWGDIAIGVTAPIVGYLLWRDAGRFRAIGVAWCVLGILDLVLVLYKALRSAPGALQATSFDLPTVIVGYFPFPIVPLLIVPVSLILHGVMLWKLAEQTSGKRPAIGDRAFDPKV